MKTTAFTRRDFLRAGIAGGAGLAGLTLLSHAGLTQAQAPHPDHAAQAGLPPIGHGAHAATDGAVGDVDTSAFDPMQYLYHFDFGRVSTLPNGQTLREWDINAINREIEVAPGVFFPAWTYDGQVPGRTFRCTQGDRLRFNFGNGADHPHTIHFHGIHPPAMDGITPAVNPGERFVYEFDAKPFGLHLYHCHAVPLKRHIHKGLYGVFIVDPPGGRPPAREMVMMMNGFDTNFDGENEIYAVNTVAFHYAKHPIQVKVGELVRVYLVNITEFDPINSFHLHAGMVKLFKTGTRLDYYEYTDIAMLCQGERAVLEFTLDYPGQYMFHAHQSELAELGWMGLFEAVA
ncbi:MAG: multicopper oxidase domain-containing protein [Anaerolineales bacterium]|nr:multicopper oxidase domain-containing protein [Anaerolineales bacterium]